MQNNVGNYATGIGGSVLYNNSGVFSSGVGYGALLYNSGDFVTGVGSGVLSYNTGSDSSAVGHNSLRNNSGGRSSGLGVASLLNNIGFNVVGVGEESLLYNVGEYSSGFGNETLRYNQGANNTALGYRAFSTFNDDTANAKNFAPVDIDTANNRITVTAHGFGATNDFVNLRFTTTGTMSSGNLHNTTIYQFRIIDANTLESTIGNQILGLSSQGTCPGGVNDTCHTLTPQFVYTNSTALGYNAEPTASNQIMMGDTNITNVTTSGNLTLGAITIPNTDGTNGQVLQTNGSGSLSWVDGGALGYWSKTGTNISPTTAGDDLLLNTGETLSIADMTQGSLTFIGANGLVTQDNSSLFWDDTNDRLGVGMNTNLTEAINIDGNLHFAEPIAAPSTPTVAVNASAGSLNGNYRYRITFVDNNGKETNALDTTATVSPVNQQVDLTNIAISPDNRVVARRIYRNEASQNDYTGPWKLVTIINDNTTTTYTDNIADGSLGSDYAPDYNETSGTIYSGNDMIFTANSDATFVGFQAGASNGGHDSTGFGYQALQNNQGLSTTGFGYQALQNNTGVRVVGMGRGALQNNEGDESVGFGNSALESNTGNHSSGFGNGALRNNTGSSSSGFGEIALQNNTGAFSSGFGQNALSNNTGGDSSGFGASALSHNTGDASSGFGNGALRNNTGNYSSGFGFRALYDNVGNYVAGFGYQSLQNNNGTETSGFGAFSLINNVADYSSGFGSYTLHNNIGEYSSGFGNKTLWYNQGANNTALGYGAFNTFNDDTANAKNFAPSDINTATERITITGHSFGADGDYINLRFTTTGTAPNYLQNSYIYQFKIIDANTVEQVEGNQTGSALWTQGTCPGGVNDTCHTLTPQFVYTNSTALGYDAEPTASNQIMMGDGNVLEVVPGSDGTVNLGSGTARWNTVYAANGTINTSDIRLKKNITQLGYGLEDLLKINPIMFNWKDDEVGKGKKLGFSAQELQTIIPEVVREAPDGSLGVYYSDLIPVAFSAIKSLYQEQEQQGIKIESNTLKTDSNVQTLAQLQTSVDDNLTIINQTLVTMQTSQEAINSQQELKNSEQEEAITGNTQSLATLSENITDLAETSDLLVNTVDDHETRIALLEDTISKIQDTNGEDTSDNNQDTNDGQDPNNPQTPNLTNLSEALESFSTNLALTEEGTTCIEDDEDCTPTQPVFTLSGDLIVERLKAKKIEAEEIEVAGITVKSRKLKVGSGEDIDNFNNDLPEDDNLDGISEDASSDTSGSGEIKIGDNFVIIKTTAIQDDDRVFITPRVLTERNIAVTEIQAGKSFKVETLGTITDNEEAIKFDWLIIGQ